VEVVTVCTNTVVLVLVQVAGTRNPKFAQPAKPVALHALQLTPVGPALLAFTLLIISALTSAL
jgi:hypothetical protein